MKGKPGEDPVGAGAAHQLKPLNGARPQRDESTELRRAVSEELFHAWQSHLHTLEQQLEEGWRQRIQNIVDDRFSDLSKSVAHESEGRFREELSETRKQAAAEAARDTTEALNRAARIIGTAANREQWVKALMGEAVRHTQRAAILTLRDFDVPLAKSSLNLDMDSGLALGSEPVPLCYAPALLSAMDSGMPVTAMRSGAEISVALENMLGPGAPRVQVFPLMATGTAFGVLYTEGAADGNALDLLANIAGLCAATKREILKQAGLEKPAVAAASPRPVLWNDLPPKEQEIHLKAHRFARTQAAQLRLYKPQEVREGRAEGRLYEILQQPIDDARRAYQDQFMTGCQSMVDYFHTELVKTLANNDERLLGGAYPGPLH